MKKIFVLSILVCITFTTAFAQLNPKLNNIQTRKFLKESNIVIFKAKEVVQKHKIYSGDFTKAVIHQRYAIDMFNQKKYVKAIYHSLSARHYANASINANTRNNVKLISRLSEEERSILLDNSDSGFNGDFRPSEEGQDDELFVKMAIHEVHRRDIDHVDYLSNKDRDFSNSILMLQL